MSFPISRQLSWQPNPDPTGGVPSSYEVRMNGAVIATPTTSPLPVSIPAPGTYTFEVRAVNVYGVSGPAQVVEIAMTPGAPVNVHID